MENPNHELEESKRDEVKKLIHKKIKKPKDNIKQELVSDIDELHDKIYSEGTFTTREKKKKDRCCCW